VEVWLFGFLISQLLVLGVTALENVYYDMADITTTATFNAESKTYDISPTTPFNITCFYVNADFTYEYAEVSIFFTCNKLDTFALFITLMALLYNLLVLFFCR